MCHFTCIFIVHHFHIHSSIFIRLHDPGYKLPGLKQPVKNKKPAADDYTTLVPVNKTSLGQEIFWKKKKEGKYCLTNWSNAKRHAIHFRSQCSFAVMWSVSEGLGISEIRTKQLRLRIFTYNIQFHFLVIWGFIDSTTTCRKEKKKVMASNISSYY